MCVGCLISSVDSHFSRFFSSLTFVRAERDLGCHFTDKPLKINTLNSSFTEACALFLVPYRFFHCFLEVTLYNKVSISYHEWTANNAFTAFIQLRDNNVFIYSC